VAQLQIELTASATNAASASASTADDAPLAADVRELAATLDQLNARHVSSMASNKSSTGGSATTTTTTTNKASSIDSSSSSAAESAALERRVAQMESALGLDKSAAPARTDLADAVASLEQRMRDVLDFDATSARVRTLSADIDAVVAKAAAAAATASSAGDGAAASKDGHADGSPLLALRAQVVEAHTLLRQVAPLIKTIPAIAERLRALRTLHTAALDAAGVAARIESAHSDVQSQLKSNSELLAALQKSTAQNNATVKENMAALTKRIESLPK
jgi:hypothetical protein